MNALVLPEVLMNAELADEPALESALTPSSVVVQRYVWQSAFGAMLIEVRDGAAFVNGDRVLPMAALREAGSS
jgi:hypothetical protein